MHGLVDLVDIVKLAELSWPLIELSSASFGIVAPPTLLTSRRYRAAPNQTKMMLATLFLASSASALSATSWQKRLDRAVLDVDLSVEQRVRNLQRVVQATPEVLSDVRSAVDAVRVKGFAEGHVEFLDTLFPVGATARSDLEGLQALRKQVPEVRAALRTQAAPSAPPAVDSAEATKAAKQIARDVAGLRDTKKRKALEEEIKNAFRSTPKGLETPAYAVEETLGAVELRAYEPYALSLIHI